MKTKITLLGFAIATIFSSCSKETFLMSSNTGGYGAYHKTEKVKGTQVAAPVGANTDEAILTASAETTPAVIAQVPSFTAPKTAKVAAKATESASAAAVAPVAMSKKELKAAVKAAKKEIKDVKGTKAGGKSQIVALILALPFLLGLLGLHRFYLGYTGKGILQLAMFLVGVVLSAVIIGLPILLALWIWVIIDFIRILTGGLQPKDGTYEKTL